MARSVCRDVSENRVSPSIDFQIFIENIASFVGKFIYITSRAPKNPMLERFNYSKKQIAFFESPKEIAFPPSYHTRWRYRDRTRILTHIYGKILFLYSIAWITRFILSILRGLCLSSRIIPFILIVLPLSSLLSFPDAQTFENALCLFNLWQSLFLRRLDKICKQLEPRPFRTFITNSLLIN